ncbi:MAG: exodeoxyribonuclease VII large subunit [Lachnospiraceae bacterium]|jgi:exodeoxyribonuclease VII large subunit|nr:exodeoxyribonuclease VII large subunit [Lachnospiraceae bacterium]
MEEVRTVSQINLYIKNMFVRDYSLQRVMVKGEISNCKYHSSGHIYFTIKDRASQLSCVMFASNTKNLDFRMQEGQSVVVYGSISVYERDGKYQLYAVGVRQEGAGQLYEEYEKLKKRLLSEGLFDNSRKKEIPKYAKKIGVVTAQTGAVIQDICNVSHRRNPYVQILLYPAKVQGEDAHLTIIRGLQYFETTDVDTVIIGRGGGSIEDLWAFNCEELAYAIAGCKKPIISAVGHETDTTIADYVADLRAPTPSAAAEIAVYAYRELEIGLREYQYTLNRQMENTVQICRMRLNHYETVLSHASPQDLLKQKRLHLADYEDKMGYLIEQKIVSAKHQLALYVEELKGLSPLYKLQGGYSYVADMDGNHVRSVEKLQKGQELRLSMMDGQALVLVEDIKKEAVDGKESYTGGVL